MMNPALAGNAPLSYSALLLGSIHKVTSPDHGGRVLETTMRIFKDNAAGNYVKNVVTRPEGGEFEYTLGARSPRTYKVMYSRSRSDPHQMGAVRIEMPGIEEYDIPPLLIVEASIDASESAIQNPQARGVHSPSGASMQQQLNREFQRTQGATDGGAM